MEAIKTPKIERVLLRQFHQSRDYVTGTLCLTDTHMIFIEPTGARETWLLYHHIYTTERLSLTTKGYPLVIETKTFRQLHFIIPRESDCVDVMDTIKMFAQPDSYPQLYAYQYRPKPSETLKQTSGWALYDPMNEYGRMGVPNELWTHTALNRNYELSETYSKDLFVPTAADNNTLIGSAKFRSKGRLPVLSFYYAPNNTALCRSSQPLVGLRSRSVEDEQMVQAIVDANPNSEFIYVIDTRPKINAMANKAAGKGYESTDNYSNVVYEFYNIHNIHVMRESLQRVLEATFAPAQSTPSHFLSTLESSGWMKHIHLILEVSNFCANSMVEKGVSVMVHCSDGWDRTAQTCALISLFIDPHYRTLHGFMVLIEKEWLSFGHKFSIRNSHLSTDNREFSPIFTQFLDCVWQTMVQFPTAFQFNEQFLVTIHDHVHSCQFGTFLGNCEREREQLRLREHTHSFWGHVWVHLDDFINPLYSPNSSDIVLVPETSIPLLSFWQGLYCRYNSWEQPSELVEEVMGSLHQQSDCLAEHIRFLEEHISTLKNSLSRFQDQLLEKKLPEDRAAPPSSTISEGNSELATGNDSRTSPAASLQVHKEPPPSSSSGRGHGLFSPLSLEDEDATLIDEIEDSLQYSVTAGGVGFRSENNRRASENSAVSTNGASCGLDPDSNCGEERTVSELVSRHGGEPVESKEGIDREAPFRNSEDEESSLTTSNEGVRISPPTSPLLDGRASSSGEVEPLASDSELGDKKLLSTSVVPSEHRLAVLNSETDDTSDPHSGTQGSGVGEEQDRQGKLAETRLSPTSLDEFKDILDHVSDMNLPWQPLRGVRQCSCGVAFSFSVRKFHCSFCGVVVCGSCSSNHATLPWHVTTSKPQRVCKTCFKLMRSRQRDLETLWNS